MNEQIKAAKLKFPAGMELDDYSFGFVRRDGATPKPVLQFLIDSDPNGQAGLSKPRELKIPLSEGNEQNPAPVTVNSDYSVRLESSSPSSSSRPR
jgi:hypothetical protein